MGNICGEDLAPKRHSTVEKNKTDAQAETVTKRRYVLEVIATGSSMKAGRDWGRRSGYRR